MTYETGATAEAFRSEGIAREAGWQDDDADGERIMLRAQIALATGCLHFWAQL
jgi:hypothetical protein